MVLELVFNELSVVYDRDKLAETPQEARQWLIDLSKILGKLLKYRNADTLRVPKSDNKTFLSTRLFQGHTIARILEGESSEVKVPQENRELIQSFIARGTYLEDKSKVEDDDGIFESDKIHYIFEHENRICRGLGAAYLLKGWAVSLYCGDSTWDCKTVEIYNTLPDVSETYDVKHVSRASHLDFPRREFERNPKHDFVADEIIIDGEKIAKMNLSDKEAQAILDKAVSPPGDKRFYGYSVDRDTFYVFPEHETGYYHGYPIDDMQDLRRNKKVILRKLKERGVIDSRIYGKHIKS